MSNTYVPEILEEIRKSLQKMFKDKTEGRDELNTEMLEAGGPGALKWLTSICNHALKERIISRD